MPNGIFDSINVCGDGDVQFYVSGKAYPQKGIGAGDVLPNLRKVIGSMGDKHTSFSIDTKEMSFTAQQLTTLTSREIPSKFYVSTNLSILPFSPVLLSGVSSANSSVNVRMNISTATVKPVNASLLLYYDLIIEIDTATRTASVKQ